MRVRVSESEVSESESESECERVKMSSVPPSSSSPGLTPDDASGLRPPSQAPSAESRLVASRHATVPEGDDDEDDDDDKMDESEAIVQEEKVEQSPLLALTNLVFRVELSDDLVPSAEKEQIKANIMKRIRDDS